MELSFTERRIGTVVPLGALRGKDSIGIGEYPDLAEFAAFCAGAGVTLIQLLPVNDTGYEGSPYSALSAFALNPLYIKIGAIPQAEKFAGKIAALGEKFDRAARYNTYEIAKAKFAFLREIFDANEKSITKSAESGEIADWIKENNWVKTYAVFRELKEENNLQSWVTWKEAGIGKDGIERRWEDAALRSGHLFWTWLQVIADGQFSAAAQAVEKAGILLEGDIPILMGEDSADVWEFPEIFDRSLCAGAPPDMYAPDGQNWGFPIYNWANLEKSGYAWWKNRLKTAAKYYKAYRIDHVLGFFRIWASSSCDNSALLGRFIPYKPIKRADLTKLGLDNSRIRWLSQPHLPTNEVWAAAGGREDEARVIFERALDRIGGEELWLFKPSVKGEKDITALPVSDGAKNYLTRAWSNRLFLEYSEGEFFPTWKYRESRAWQSLSSDEKKKISALLEKNDADSQKLWEKEGKKLLEVITKSTDMLPCAEDLGAVPDCVPRVLAALKILSLRVVRWARLWEKTGSPYIPLEDYPEMSVCTPSVHDSSTLREWWDGEAEQDVFCAFIGEPALPRVYNPGTARAALLKIAGAASRFRVFQIQDLMHLSSKWYADNPASERINVPGTYNNFNWTWRLPEPIADIAQDAELISRIKEIAAVPAPNAAHLAAKKNKAGK